MKIRYEYVNNEVIEVEVDDALGMEIGALELAQARRNRAETRRHASLEQLMEQAVQFAADTDVATIADAKIMAALLREAMIQLSPQQQRLLRQVYLEHLTWAEIAAQEGINKSSAYRRHERLIAHLQRIFTDSATTQ